MVVLLGKMYATTASNIDGLDNLTFANLSKQVWKGYIKFICTQKILLHQTTQNLF